MAKTCASGVEEQKNYIATQRLIKLKNDLKIRYMQAITSRLLALKIKHFASLGQLYVMSREKGKECEQMLDRRKFGITYDNNTCNIWRKK